MKTHILSAVASLFIAAALTSCVNEVYDFNNLNMEMTVVPGISIPVGKSLGEVGSDNLLGITNCSTDDNGTYVQSGETSKSEVTLSAEEIQTGTVYSDKTISVPVSAPDFLKNSKTEFRLHNPEIEFQINNPLSSNVILRGKAQANGQYAGFEVEIPADAVSYSVKMGGKSLSDILFPIPENIIIGDLSFTAKPATKAGDGSTAGSVVYELFAKANIRMEFEAGSEISFDTTLDLVEMGADLSKISVSVNEFDVLTSVTSTFPLDLSASASSEDGNTTLSLANAVMACATTDVTLKAKTDGELSSIKKVFLSVSAKNSSSGPVALSPANTLDIDVNRLTAVSGITYTPK